MTYVTLNRIGFISQILPRVVLTPEKVYEFISRDSRLSFDKKNVDDDTIKLRIKRKATDINPYETKTMYAPLSKIFEQAGCKLGNVSGVITKTSNKPLIFECILDEPEKGWVPVNGSDAFEFSCKFLTNEIKADGTAIRTYKHLNPQWATDAPILKMAGLPLHAKLTFNGTAKTIPFAKVAQLPSSSSSDGSWTTTILVLGAIVMLGVWMYKQS
ncbi:hypothetical protein HvAV-3i_gp104 [Heliothis virescens ascovirus 3i]|nr:hypothetical protein HvAV-3i_gp104 [Heliothis virescens ascovirus 3i]